MKRALPIIAAVIAIGAAGCNRNNTDQPANSMGNSASRKLVNPKITMVRGCLTGTDGQFVLTDLAAAAATPNGAAQPPAESIATTDSYRLIGKDDELRGFVGQRIEVTGDSTPDQVVDLVGATPANAPASTSGTSSGDGKVSTSSRAKIEVHELRVSSVNPLGDRCAG